MPHKLLRPWQTASHPVRDAIADLQNGWSPNCLDRPADAGEGGVLKLGAVSFGEYDPAVNKALPSHLSPMPEYEVKPRDVLISRANITHVGACAYVYRTRAQLLLCDKIFRVLFKKETLIDGQFIAAIMKTQVVRRQIENSFTGTSPTMKNISKPALLNLLIPLPAFSEHVSIMEQLEDCHTKAHTARTTAAATREAAAEVFTAALFTTTNKRL